MGIVYDKNMLNPVYAMTHRQIQVTKDKLQGTESMPRMKQASTCHFIFGQFTYLSRNVTVCTSSKTLKQKGDHSFIISMHQVSVILYEFRDGIGCLHF